ncbi:hypothetical protein IQ268_06475 [Oculatella sp. LEGE 06141]|nr:hypothetical protein [Oculatella sp. LEGE 06141]
MLAQTPSEASDSTRLRSSCPADLETLVALLLHDLPAYTNRVRQRAIGRNRSANVPGYMLLAARPEFDPLTLGPGEYVAGIPADSDTTQVFFTTLERQYVSNTAVNLQHYHWLFLTQTMDGHWRLVLMISRIGGYPASDPPSPPQDSSYGVVAQSIRLWLRDCRAGRVRSPQSIETR